MAKPRISRRNGSSETSKRATLVSKTGDNSTKVQKATKRVDNKQHNSKHHSFPLGIIFFRTRVRKLMKKAGDFKW